MSTVTAVPIAPVKRGYLVWLWLGIAVAVVAAGALAWAAPRDPTAMFLAQNRHAPGVKETPSGLQYQVLTPGSGPTPTDSDVALAMYEGALTSGTTFDQSAQPVPFPLGEHGTVPGFEEALKLMPRGAKYRVWLKPGLGYGAQEKRDQAGNVVIPANSVLVFTLDMMDFRSKEFLRQMRLRQMMQQGGRGTPGDAGVPGGADAPAGANPPQPQ